MKRFAPTPAAVVLAVAVTVVLTLALAACSRPLREIPPPQPHLELYEVPHDLADEVRNALLEAVRTREGEPTRGRVSLSPGGGILVLASPTVHVGVRKLLRSLERGGPQPTPPTIEITYWIVVGRPASPPAPAPSGGLREVGSVLSTLDETLGPLEYRLVERLQLSSRSDFRGSTSGAVVRVTQRAHVAGDEIVASLEIDPTGGPDLRTDVRIDEGRTVVLAQTSVGNSRPVSWDSGADEMLFYVVRARQM